MKKAIRFWGQPLSKHHACTRRAMNRKGIGSIFNEIIAETTS
jgi:hypothetical protein